MSNKIEKARKYFNIMKSGIERGLNKLKVDGTDFVEIAETLFAEIDRLTAALEKAEQANNAALYVCESILKTVSHTNGNVHIDDDTHFQLKRIVNMVRSTEPTKGD